jgi:hypothetical protein
VLASIDLPSPCCGDSDAQLYSAGGGAIGTIHQRVGCGENMITISGIDGPALYSLGRNPWSCDDTLSVTQLSTNQVIGRMENTKGCCDGGRFVVTYPQELPLDHKLLLIVAMCMMQLSRDSQNN